MASQSRAFDFDRQQMLLGCIADDFTGASEIAEVNTR
jgi:hypothetical protein